MGKGSARRKEDYKKVTDKLGKLFGESPNLKDKNESDAN